MAADRPQRNVVRQTNGGSRVEIVDVVAIVVLFGDGVDDGLRQPPKLDERRAAKLRGGSVRLGDWRARSDV